MQTASQAGLLERFIRSQDAEAFALITRQYAGLVYGTCIRITGNKDRAADATQETFFHLAKHARQISGSLAGWLHHVAVSKSVNLVRSDVARRRREEEYATQPRETDDWSEISPLVDEALQELDEESRDILLRHYLQGETLTNLAQAKGVSQPTMSRRAEAALEQMRLRLKSKGVLVAAVSLGGLMSSATTSAPAAVLTELGKMALAASGATAAGTATATAFNVKLAAATLIVIAGVGGLMVYKANRRAEPAPRVAAATAPPATPRAVSEPTTAKGDLPTTPVEPRRTALAPGPAPTGRIAPPLGFGGFATPGDTAPTGTANVPEGMAIMAVNSGPPPTRATIDGALTLFSFALVRGDEAQLKDCFADPAEAEALCRLLEKDPGDGAEREVQQMLKSIGPRIEIRQTTATDEGLTIKWIARVRQPFITTENGVVMTWQRGDRFELTTVLKQIGGEWKIIRF